MELECSVQYASDYPVLWIRLDKETGQNPLLISSGWNNSEIICCFIFAKDVMHIYLLQEAP